MIKAAFKRGHVLVEFVGPCKRRFNFTGKLLRTERKVLRFNVRLKSQLNQLVYHTNQTEKLKREKTKRKADELMKSGNGHKIREISPKR